MSKYILLICISCAVIACSSSDDQQNNTSYIYHETFDTLDAFYNASNCSTDEIGGGVVMTGVAADYTLLNRYDFTTHHAVSLDSYETDTIRVNYDLTMTGGAALFGHYFVSIGIESGGRTGFIISRNPDTSLLDVQGYSERGDGNTTSAVIKSVADDSAVKMAMIITPDVSVQFFVDGESHVNTTNIPVSTDSGYLSGVLLSALIYNSPGFTGRISDYYFIKTRP